MITAISFQFGYNKKYLNKELHPVHIFSDKYTTQLEILLAEDINILTNVKKIVEKLNADLTNANVKEVILSVYPNKENHIRITNLTKKKRTYSFAGLTIHEEDK